MSNSKRVSLEPAIFRVKSGPESDILVGSKCQKCHRVFFPPRVWCAACVEPTCEELELSREGMLLSFALVNRAQTYCVIEAPYVLGEVLLPEGPHIYTSISAQSDITPEGVKVRSTINEGNLNLLEIGQKVMLTPILVRKDEEGNDVFAFNFTVVETK